jgi:hypothetical protein
MAKIEVARSKAALGNDMLKVTTSEKHGAIGARSRSARRS